MKLAILAVSLLLLTGNALADPQPWMKKESPGELSVETGVTEPCEISEQQLRDTVEGVLIRSSITPARLGESRRSTRHRYHRHGLRTSHSPLFHT